MDALETKDAERSALLETFYDIVEGDSMVFANINDANQILKWTNAKLSRTAQWLCDRDLLKAVAFGGTYSITPTGIDAVEDARREAAILPTPRTDSEIAIVILTIDERRSVEAALTEFDRAEIETKLSGDDRHEFIADRNTIREQIESPRPKKEIVFAALRGIRKLCFVIGAGVAVAKINQVIP